MSDVGFLVGKTVVAVHDGAVPGALTSDAGISPDDALGAVVEFITTGERPATISWREV